MDDVGENHHVGARRRVHPQRGPGEAGVAEGADGEDHATRTGVGGVDVPAEAAEILPGNGRIARSQQGVERVGSRRDRLAFGVIGRRELTGGVSGLLRTRHQFQRGLGQGEGARAAREPIQQCLREQAQIPRCREHAGAARHAAHTPRGGVVNRPAHQTVEVGIEPRAVFVMSGRRDARQQVDVPGVVRAIGDLRCGRIECDRIADDSVRATCPVGREVVGVSHAERIEDVALDVDVFRLTGDFLEQCPEDDEADIGVVEDLTGIERQGRAECAPDALGFVGPVQTPWAGHAQITREPRGVRQQHAQSHLRPPGVVRRIELRKVGLHGIVDLYPALFVELQKSRRRGDALGHRREVEDGVLGHRLGRRGFAVEARFAVELAVAERAAEDDLPAVPHLDHRAGHPMFGDRVVDQSGDRGEVAVGSHRLGYRRTG